MGTLVTGATGPLQSGQAHITGNILPLSHHQYSHDYLITRYSVITSLLPGRKTARAAVSGRNCSMPKLNLTVLLFKIIPWAHAISGQNKERRHKEKQFPGLEMKQKEAGRHRIKTENLANTKNGYWICRWDTELEICNLKVRSSFK